MNEECPLEQPGLRPTISSRTVSGQNSPRREMPGSDLPIRPTMSGNNSSFEGPTSLGREASIPAASRPSLIHVPTDPSQLYGARNGLRQTSRGERGADVFGDEYSDSSEPTSAVDSARSVSWSMSAQDGPNGLARKAPPPPPPSRAKKPPPPPPVKRSALSTSEIPRY